MLSCELISSHQHQSPCTAPSCRRRGQQSCVKLWAMSCIHALVRFEDADAPLPTTHIGTLWALGNSIISAASHSESIFTNTFHLDLRSLQSTNVKSCCVSKTQPSACCSDDRKSRNRLWHLLTSAIDMARPGYYLHSGLLMFAIARVRRSRSSTHRGGRVRARKRRKVRSWLTGVDRLSVCQSARRKRPVCVPGSDCDAQNRSSAADGCA